MAEQRETNYSLEFKRGKNHFLEQEVAKFTQAQKKHWWRSLAALYWRRSRLLWLNLRNYGAVLIIFVAIMIESFVLKMRYEFIPYRLMIAHTAIAV